MARAGRSVCVPSSLGPPGCVLFRPLRLWMRPGWGHPGTLLQVPGAPQDGLPVTHQALPLRSRQTGVHRDGLAAPAPRASSLLSAVSLLLFFSLPARRASQAACLLRLNNTRGSSSGLRRRRETAKARRRPQVRGGHGGRGWGTSVLPGNFEDTRRAGQQSKCGVQRAPGGGGEYTHTLTS